MTLLLTKSEQGIVVFKILPSLEYKKRMAVSLLLILLGVALQIYFFNLFAGIIFIIAGNLLQLVKGYNNKIKTGKYSPDAEWSRATKSKIDELIRFDNKIKSWDRSAIDITNASGLITLIALVIFLFILITTGNESGNTILIFLAVDAALLLLPHWFTGIREILRKPKLIIKLKLIEKLIKDVKEIIKDNSIDYYLHLRGKNVKLPDDVKIKVNFKNQPKEFLGFYGQVVTNTVQGHDYPYFYVVLVAKKGFGLLKHYQSFEQPSGIVTSYSEKKDVEVFVIRQDTSVGKGYYTTRRDTKYIFEVGNYVMEKILHNRKQLE